MSEQVEPSDAARALSEIDRRREQAIRRSMRAAFPVWYWWATAVLVVVLAAAVESGRGAALWIGLAVFTIGSLATSVPVSRAARAASPHRDLGGPGTTRRGLIGMASFVAVLLAVVAGTTLGLHAAGLPHPATIAAAITAVLFAVGGQILIRCETAILIRSSRSGG
jgi:hypothetical protein